jgi:Mrp family chromosome partitioning ATPase/capsular polysaccharide biosynthesis protein
VSEPDPSILRYYLGIVWRWKWLVVLPLVVLPAIVLALSLNQPPLYASSSGVLLNHQDQVATTLAGVQTPLEDPGRYAVTQGLIARSPVLARRVLANAGFPNAPARALLDHSDVEPNADVLQFFVSNADAGVATRLANTYARQYTAFRRELDTRDLESTVQSLGARLQRLDREGRRSSLLYRQLTAQQEQVQLLETLRRSNVYVIRTSSPGDADQLAPRPLRNTALALAGAIVLGLLLVAVANAFDRRVFDIREIAEALGAPLLGRVPVAPRGEAPEADDALRLAALVNQAARAAGARALLLSTAGTNSRPAVVSALAEGLAHLEGRVVLVDADLRNRDLTRAYKLEGRGGLVERIGGDTAGGDATQIETGGGGALHVLPAGADVRDPGALLVSSAAAAALRQLAEHADLVVVAGPPFGSAPESLTLAGAVDAVVLVIRPGIDRRALGEARRALDVSPAAALGFLLLDPRRGGSLPSRRLRPDSARTRGAGSVPEAAELGARTAPEEASC